MSFFIRLSWAFVTVVLLAASPVEAEASAPFMITSGPTSQPIGHYEFCRREPQDCDQKATSDQPLVLTPKLWSQILDVNFQVNSTIKPETDKALYGVEEYWAYPTTAGDCEDYALLKRRILIEDGVPPSDVLMTVVRQPDGAGHAVLTVRTDRGDFILDNMQSRVELWSRTDYTYLKRQSPLDSGRWDKINDGRPALVGSVN